MPRLKIMTSSWKREKLWPFKCRVGYPGTLEAKVSWPCDNEQDSFILFLLPQTHRYSLNLPDPRRLLTQAYLLLMSTTSSFCLSILDAEYIPFYNHQCPLALSLRTFSFSGEIISDVLLTLRFLAKIPYFSLTPWFASWSVLKDSIPIVRFLRCPFYKILRLSKLYNIIQRIMVLAAWGWTWR